MIARAVQRTSRERPWRVSWPSGPSSTATTRPCFSQENVMQGWHTRNARTPVRNSPQRSALLSRPIPFLSWLSSLSHPRPWPCGGPSTLSGGRAWTGLCRCAGISMSVRKLPWIVRAGTHVQRRLKATRQPRGRLTSGEQSYCRLQTPAAGHMAYDRGPEIGPEILAEESAWGRQGYQRPLGFLCSGRSVRSLTDLAPAFCARIFRTGQEL